MHTPWKALCPTALRRFLLSRPSGPASLHNTPARWQNSAYGCHWCCCPQICNKFLRVSAAFPPDNMHEPKVPVCTFYKNPKFPAGCRCKQYRYPIPAVPVRHRKLRPAPRLSWAAVCRGSEAVPVYFSYPHARCTIFSAFPAHPDKFCREWSFLFSFCFLLSSFLCCSHLV